MRFLFLFLVCFLLGKMAYASCGSAVHGAEEGVRLQSRLMVISLNCQHLFLSHGQNMYQQYRAFEARHRGLFGEYEDVLIRAGGRDITALRTQESNDVSLEAARMRPDLFCMKYAPMITQAAMMNENDVRYWVNQKSRQVCQK